jgi:hypothetical protein
VEGAPGVTIAGWPGHVLARPSVARRRLGLERRGLTAQQVPGELAEAREDTPLRVAELDVEDPASVVALLNEIGLPVTPDDEPRSLGAFAADVARVRETVTAWRVLSDEATLAEGELAGCGFATFPNVRAAAAEFLNVTLAVELRPFSPLVWVTDGIAPPAQAGRDVTLTAACFLELHNHVVSRTVYGRCANESCRRLFPASTAGRSVRYCSPGCRRAQAQREFRRRRAGVREDSAA